MPTPRTDLFAQNYAPFKAAEQGRDVKREAAYLTAMEQRYGLNLPPCRLMIGCASEH